MQSLKKIQYTSKFIQFFSTKLAVKFAYKLLMTPIKHKVPEREVTMQKSSQIKPVFIDSIQKEVNVLEYGYSNKRVLLIHGWSGRSTQFFRIADKLLENGYMVVSFYAPAHGESEYKQTNILEFIEVIKHLYNKYNGFTSAVGHSMGGSAIYNASKKLDFTNFVTIGSANKITDVFNLSSKKIGMNTKVATKLIQFLENKFQVKLDDYSSVTRSKYSNTPILIVHDENDKEVPVNCAYEINKVIKNSKLKITKGLGHTRILRDNDVANHIINFIKHNT